MSHRHNRFTALFSLALMICLAAAVSTISVSAQKKDKEAKESSKKDKKAKKASSAPTAPGTPKLWEDRGNVASLNLVYGIGSPDGMPKPPFQFDKEDVTGTNPKIKVIDANGIKWNIKFDEEVHAEVASSRIVWACGYMVEESYFLASGKVNGVTGLGRAKKFVGSDGSFTNGMFEKRPDDVARRAINWDWTGTPFTGTKELSGLVILNTLLNNWDAKNTNNNVLGMFDDDGKVIDWYLVADWGGSFGKMGGFTSHTKWDLADYQKQAFLDGVSGGQVKLHYSGKMSSSMRTVPVEHARWFAGILGQLTDAQIQDAFKAAGASPAETDGFSRRIRQKINELKSAVGR